MEMLHKQQEIIEAKDFFNCVDASEVYILTQGYIYSIRRLKWLSLVKTVKAVEATQSAR